MSNIEYLLYAIKHELIYKINWFYSVMVIYPSPDFENEYIAVKEGKCYAKTEDGLVLISGCSYDKPILGMKDTFTVTNELCANVDKPTETTLGRFLINRLVLSDNTGTLIPYINKMVGVGSVEKEIGILLRDDKITTSQFVNAEDACVFLQGLSRITTVSVTERSVLPPKGIKRFKKELVNTYNDKYGVDWVKDRSLIVEFEKELKNYDNDYLKDDPTNGKILSGKVKDNARAKMYLTFGADGGFDKKGLNPNIVMESLMDGYPKDVDQLTNMFNTSRSGSFDRGKETQKGGAAAKDVLRATSSIVIKDNDCGTTVGKLITVTSEIVDSLKGRYIIINGKSTVIDDPKIYLGKEIEIRSPMYCNNDGISFCSKCSGDVLSNYKTGISLLVTDISGILLNTSMKSMHGNVLSTVNFDITKKIM